MVEAEGRSGTSPRASGASVARGSGPLDSSGSLSLLEDPVWTLAPARGAL